MPGSWSRRFRTTCFAACPDSRPRQTRAIATHCDRRELEPAEILAGEQGSRSTDERFENAVGRLAQQLMQQHSLRGV